MDKNIRDVRQQEFAEQWLNSKRFSIMYLAPRFGKIYCTINILEQLNPHCTILIVYPDNKIRHSWEEDFKKRGYDDCDVVYTTYLSLHKWIEKFDIIILDECHTISPAQIEVCKNLFETNKAKLQVIALTGTLSRETKNTLWNELKLPILATYSIEQAIEEGVIADYEISVIKVPLDNRIIQLFGTKRKTEKQRWDNLVWIVKKKDEEEEPTFFLKLMMIKVLQNSIAKLNKTKELIQKYKDERVLIFCGLTKIADSLGIPSYHSKSTEKKLFEDFASGIGNHLAVVKIGNTGVLYKPLDKVIINYTDSNSENLSQKILRCMNFEYNNPEKIAKIFLISSNEKIELDWTNKALSMFSKDKIKYL